MLKDINNAIKEISEIIDNLGELAISLTGFITLIQLLISLIKKK